MNSLISFVSLDLYSYWYHRLCHKYNVTWHTHHHNGESVEMSCAKESIISASLIFGGVKIYENVRLISGLRFYTVCRATCGIYWGLVSSSHYLSHKLDYSNVFPINKIQIKHLFHHKNPNFNFSVILPFDILFMTSNFFE